LLPQRAPGERAKGASLTGQAEDSEIRSKEVGQEGSLMADLGDFLVVWGAGLCRIGGVGPSASSGLRGGFGGAGLRVEDNVEGTGWRKTFLIGI